MPTTRGANKQKKAKVEDVFTFGKYLELVDGENGTKFWEIKLGGSTTIVRYGKSSKQGARQVKEHSSEADALNFAQKAIKDKTKKGYVLVNDLGNGNVDDKSDAAEFVQDKVDEKSYNEPDATNLVNREGTQNVETEADTKQANDHQHSTTGNSNNKPNYFELKDDKGGKFWECRLEDKTVHVRYGKVGKTGTKNSKVHSSEEAACTAMEKLIKEKTKKGYVKA